MIAKLIVSAPSREEAIQRLIGALEDYRIEGIKTNIPMLQQVVTHHAFQDGDTTTQFVEKYF
jgi:acetyl-CoA carboxylase biotin carboxylase subunit